jgi:ParB family chromosome partitioning protein
LNRDLTGSCGSKAYANEELAAEIKSAHVCATPPQTFGVTELDVKQRFALATLHSSIKDAYRDGDITPETSRFCPRPLAVSKRDGSQPFEQESDRENEEAEGAPRGPSF